MDSSTSILSQQIGRDIRDDNAVASSSSTPNTFIQYLTAPNIRNGITNSVSNVVQTNCNGVHDISTTTIRKNVLNSVGSYSAAPEWISTPLLKAFCLPDYLAAVLRGLKNQPRHDLLENPKFVHTQGCVHQSNDTLISLTLARKALLEATARYVRLEDVELLNVVELQSEFDRLMSINDTFSIYFPQSVSVSFPKVPIIQEFFQELHLFPNLTTQHIVLTHKYQKFYEQIVEKVKAVQRQTVQELELERSSGKLLGNIVRIAAQPSKGFYVLILNRYLAFCKVLQIPAFPITLWKTTIFLARTADNNLGRMIRNLIPEPVEYRLPIAPLPGEVLLQWLDYLTFTQNETQVYWDKCDIRKEELKERLGSQECRACIFKLLEPDSLGGALSEVAIKVSNQAVVIPKVIAPVVDSDFRRTPLTSISNQGSIVHTLPPQLIEDSKSLPQNFQILEPQPDSNPNSLTKLQQVSTTSIAFLDLTFDEDTPPPKEIPLFPQRVPPFPPSLELEDYYFNCPIPKGCPLPTIPPRVPHLEYESSQEAPRKRFVPPGRFSKASTFYRPRSPEVLEKESELDNNDSDSPLLAQEDSEVESRVKLVDRSEKRKLPSRAARTQALIGIDHYNDLTLAYQGRAVPASTSTSNLSNLPSSLVAPRMNNINDEDEDDTYNFVVYQSNIEKLRDSRNLKRRKAEEGNSVSPLKRRRNVMVVPDDEEDEEVEIQEEKDERRRSVSESDIITLEDNSDGVEEEVVVWSPRKPLNVISFEEWIQFE